MQGPKSVCETVIFWDSDQMTSVLTQSALYSAFSGSSPFSGAGSTSATGNLSAAILISALIIHGLTPGPLIFKQHGAVLYRLFGTMLMANLFNLVIVLLCFSGAYLTTQSMFTVGLMVGFAILGYMMRKFDYSIVASNITFIFGPLFEDVLRQTIVLFEDQSGDLLERPTAIALVFLTAYLVWRLGFGSKPKILQEP